MREIKFRAWDKINKVMCNYASDSDLMSMSFISCQPNVIWMQYTGLKDKNGKEIYEGDIVKCKKSHNNTQHIGEVVWQGNICSFNIKNYYCPTDDCPFMAFMGGEPFEVIGNIYENPDLLTK